MRTATILPDPEKERRNRREHGMGFARVASIFRGRVVEYLDEREAYQDGRERVLGMLDGIVVVLVFEPVLVETGEFAAKPISLRRAERKERRRYHEG
jgi:uncharacterized DUF497 family protein